MRFEVPQFIEIEDKIIGPFTWRQFIYLAGGAGILTLLFFSVPFIILLSLGVPVGALSVALAFHRVNNRSFSIFLESFVNYFTSARLYLWQKEKEQVVVVYKTDTEELPASTLSYTHKGSLSSLSNKLEHHIQDSSL